MDSLRLKIPPFEKARTVLEALKDQEQAKRKKVRNTRCFRRLRKGHVSRQMPHQGFVCLWDVSAAPWAPGSLLPSMQGAGLS